MIYRSQATPTFEADRWRIMRYNRATGETVELTRGFDQQVDEMTVSPDWQNRIFRCRRSADVRRSFRSRSNRISGFGIATFVKPVVKNVYAGASSMPEEGGRSFLPQAQWMRRLKLWRVNADGSGLSSTH